MIIDLKAKPFVPESWTVEEHRKGGILKALPKIDLYLSEKQKTGYIQGYDLQKELEGKTVFNSNLLFWFLKHPTLIPKEWDGKYVFFWGTIYRNPYGHRSVLCLYRRGGGSWGWGYYWLGSDWYDSDPSAVLASPSSLDPKSSPQPLDLDGETIELGGVKYKLEKEL